MDRAALYTRLDTRIDHMMADGLLEEVRALQSYDWHLPSMSGLGYAQLSKYLRGEYSLGAALHTGADATMTREMPDLDASRPR